MIVLRPNMSEEERCVERQGGLLASGGAGARASPHTHAPSALASLPPSILPPPPPPMRAPCRDQELAKFEAFLKKQSAAQIGVTVRGRQRLAYPIKK